MERLLPLLLEQFQVHQFGRRVACGFRTAANKSLRPAVGLVELGFHGLHRTDGLASPIVERLQPLLVCAVWTAALTVEAHFIPAGLHKEYRPRERRAKRRAWQVARLERVQRIEKILT